MKSKIIADEIIRIDAYLSLKLNISRNKIKKYIDDEKILVDGKHKKSSYVLSIGEEITLDLDNDDDQDEIKVEKENIPLNIIYEDEDIIVINKEQGMVVHPSNTTKNHTLVNALLYHTDQLSDVNAPLRYGIVHRIDKNTSGLLVVAKNNDAHLNLQKQIKSKAARRIYIALLSGNLKEDEGVIATTIGRDPKNRKIMSAKTGEREAVTLFKVLKRYKDYTLVQFELKTGRTHQIRAHAKYISHPIVGDFEYSTAKNKFKLNGQLLHAKQLILKHPKTGKEMIFDSELPKYFEEVLDKLNK